MRTTRFLIVCLIFIACKEKLPPLNDFPIKVDLPLIDGDPMVISWDLAGADSLKLDNDVFLQSDTAYFYVVGNDIMKIRVYQKGQVVYEKYIRYQVAEGTLLGVVKPTDDSPLQNIPANFLGMQFSLFEAIPLIGKIDRNNQPFINLLKNLYKKSKQVPLYISNESTFIEDNIALQSLNLLASKLVEGGYKTLYTIELPDYQPLEYIKKINYNIDNEFIHSFVVNTDKLDDQMLEQLKLTKKDIVYSSSNLKYSEGRAVYNLDLSKGFQCSKIENEIFSNNNFVDEMISTKITSQAKKSIINLTLPFCEEQMNGMDASLWFLDFLLENLNKGITQVNVNIGNLNKSRANPFIFDIPKNNLFLKGNEKEKKAYPDNYLVNKIHPTYFSLWMVSDIIEEGNKFQKIEVDSSISKIKAYNIIEPNNKVKYLLINRDDLQSGRVFIYDTIIYRAWNSRLIAPKYPNTKGMVYGGRNFEGSYNGISRGSYYTDKITARKTGNNIPIAAASAVLVQSKH